MKQNQEKQKRSLADTLIFTVRQNARQHKKIKNNHVQSMSYEMALDPPSPSLFRQKYK